VLYSYDLLQGGTSGTVAYNTPLPIADSVWEMHAIYYLSGGTWASPSTSPYDVATLESAAGASNLPKIQAIRLGLIMRSNVAEKAPATGQSAATPGPIKLFSDTTLPISRTLATSDQNYRYRTIEATIPLRNSLMLISK
jgi:type IV pilus assembly protein PilW